MKLKFKDRVFRAQPDPFMCEVASGWAMYVTGVQGVEAYSCETPFGEWEYRGVVCRKDGYEEYWAPCMICLDGWYYLYFSCAPVGSDHTGQYLRVARAADPFGPFEDIQTLFNEFSIDAHVVKTDSGLFLWYAKDKLEGERVGTRVYVQRLLDPYTPEGTAVEAVSPSFDQEIFMHNRFREGEDWHTIEGPFWLQHGQWQYVMYSGACYQNDTYHIGYAAAKSRETDLTKVCFEKHSVHGQFHPLMTKNAEEEGVGHHSVIHYNGAYYAVYHGRDIDDTDTLGDRRTARICKLDFRDGLITAERG